MLVSLALYQCLKTDQKIRKMTCPLRRNFKKIIITRVLSFNSLQNVVEFVQFLLVKIVFIK